jgi:hypothetical protein
MNVNGVDIVSKEKHFISKPSMVFVCSFSELAMPRGRSQINLNFAFKTGVIKSNLHPELVAEFEIPSRISIPENIHTLTFKTR